MLVEVAARNHLLDGVQQKEDKWDD